MINILCTQYISVPNILMRAYKMLLATAVPLTKIPRYNIATVCEKPEPFRSPQNTEPSGALSDWLDSDMCIY